MITANITAWETDQLMRMEVDRFKEHSAGSEADAISLEKPETLKLLEAAPALLLYETFRKGRSAGVVRYGFPREIRVAGRYVVFRFVEEGRLTRSVLKKYADRLGLGEWEMNRTHWAVKEGGIPSSVLDRLTSSYDVVFSFAGENREYVEAVAEYLRNQGVRVFYDLYEEANLWGKHLTEHFDTIYRHNGRYCVMFISAAYKRKMWTKHERRSAMSRALTEREEYILPARFDKTDIDGIPPSIAHIDLADKTSVEFGKVILRKLGRSER